MDSLAALDALAPLGETGRAWAIIRTADNPTHAQQAKETAAKLRRSGWRATTATVRGDLPTVWTTLLTAGEME